MTPAGKNTVILIVLIPNVVLLIFLRVTYVKHQRMLFITNYYDKYEDNGTVDEYIDAEFSETMQLVDYILNAKHKMNLINERQTVHNLHSLGPVRKCTVILVIQVHVNPLYLKETLDSLKTVMGISKTLLIFSHDYFDNGINRLIKNITFAKYMQIFYPYSVQMHPRVYPGNDSQYCTEGYKCTADGYRRNAALVQRKLFWWWLLNTVFDRLDATADYNGTVIFLEQNNIVTEDLIYILKWLERIAAEDCPQCEIYGLGARSKSFEHYHVRNGYAIVESWNSKVQKIGIAFNRTIWNIIRRYSYDYCYFDDYSWENSMMYLGLKRVEGKFMMINVEGPRVFEIEKCPNKTINCNMNYMVQKVQRHVKFIKRGLYPRTMVVRHNGEETIDIKERGFFNDARDRELCMYFLNDK